MSTPMITRRPVESLTVPYTEMEVADAPPQLSVRSVIETCIRRKRILLTVFLLCIAATVAAIYLLPPRYEATMTILVQNARETPLGELGAR